MTYVCQSSSVVLGSHWRTHLFLNSPMKTCKAKRARTLRQKTISIMTSINWRMALSKALMMVRKPVLENNKQENKGKTSQNVCQLYELCCSSFPINRSTPVSMNALPPPPSMCYLIYRALFYTVQWLINKKNIVYKETRRISMRKRIGDFFGDTDERSTPVTQQIYRELRAIPSCYNNSLIVIAGSCRVSFLFSSPFLFFFFFFQLRPSPLVWSLIGLLFRAACERFPLFFSFFSLTFADWCGIGRLRRAALLSPFFAFGFFFFSSRLFRENGCITAESRESTPLHHHQRFTCCCLLKLVCWPRDALSFLSFL